MIEVKVDDLLGPALDWAVGKAIDVDGLKVFGGHVRSEDPFFSCIYSEADEFRPSTDWNQGGPLRDRYRIDVIERHPTVHAKLAGLTNAEGFGDTALIAICRAIVLAKLGDTAQVPAELLPQ